MRAWAISLIALGAVVGSYNDEPSERQMQLAFEDMLALQVRNALEFADESGGPEAVARIRENKTDRFAIKSFAKIKCRTGLEGSGHLCDFRVDIDLINGGFERTLTGRFVGGPHGLVFAERT